MIKMFYRSKRAKSVKKELLKRFVFTFIGTVLCIVAMTLTSFAYFSCNYTSASYELKAAYFDAQISVKNENGDIVQPIPVTAEATHYFFDSAGEYIVTLVKGNSTAKKGFCVVTVQGEKYHTQQLDDNCDSICFVLDVLSVGEMSVESYIGEASCYTLEGVLSITNSDPAAKITVGMLPVNDILQSEQLQEQPIDDVNAKPVFETEQYNEFTQQDEPVQQDNADFPLNTPEFYDSTYQTGLQNDPTDDMTQTSDFASAQQDDTVQ